VFTVSLPFIFINAPASLEQQPMMTPMDYVGIILFLFGLITETVADIEKYRFKANPDNKGKWCDVGKTK
jgi:steroid 5-alpha reductase family enzyme